MTTETNRPSTYAEFIDSRGGNLGVNDVGAARHLRALHKAELDKLVQSAEREARDLTASEARSFTFERDQVSLFDGAELMADHRAALIRQDRAEYGGGGTEGAPARWTTNGPSTYTKGDVRTSWIRDMTNFALRGDPDAGERLRANNSQVQAEHRALSTTTSAGGEFAPPAWLVNQYVMLARASRVTANLCTNEALPPGVSSLNIPKVLTGTATAQQATQNTAVQNTDATTGSVTANIITIAGQQVISQQLLDQSPINVDDMLLQDLLADLASKVDLFVLNNNATGAKGLLQETGTNAVTFTSASPTVALAYSKLADARQQIEVGRFSSADSIVMHPRRWAFFLAASDTAGRPLVTPSGQGPFNSFGQTDGLTSTVGLAGSMMGLPVFLDPLVPINLGAGTNQDPILVLKASDSYLYESIPQAEAFRATKADQMSVLLRVFEYAAFTTARYPKSVSVINGTGLITPTF